MSFSTFGDGVSTPEAGQVMNAVADGKDTDALLAAALSLPEERRKAIVRLLVAIGYLREADHRYSAGVPVLTEGEKPLVDAALKLSREIMTDWLHRNYAPMKKQLSGLSPMRITNSDLRRSRSLKAAFMQIQARPGTVMKALRSTN